MRDVSFDVERDRYNCPFIWPAVEIWHPEWRATGKFLAENVHMVINGRRGGDAWWRPIPSEQRWFNLLN